LARKEQKPGREDAVATTGITAIRTRPVPAGRVSVAQAPTRTHSLPGPPAVFEPIVVRDDDYAGVALQLNHEAEGISIVPPPAQPSLSLGAFEPVPRSENLDLAFLEELCRKVDKGMADGRPGVVAGLARDEISQAAGHSQVSIDTGGYIEPLAQDATSNQAQGFPTGGETAQVPTAVHGSDLLDAVACQLAEWDEGNAANSLVAAANPTVVAATIPSSIVLPPETAARAAATAPAVTIAESPTPPHAPAGSGLPWPVFAQAEPIARPANEAADATAVPWPVFAAIEQAAGTGTEIAALSTTFTDGIEGTPSQPSRSTSAQPAMASIQKATQVPPGVDSSVWALIELDDATLDETESRGLLSHGGSSPEASWGQAVQLTREAMFAWIKVLAGPALVDVSSR